MALGALTLSVTSGVQGRPFQATINGLTTGRVEVLGDGSPGFSTVNGKVMSSGLPYPVSTVVLREYEPGVGAGSRDSRIDIVAATRDSLMAQALASLAGGRKLQRFRVAGTRQADGSIIYSLIVEDDLGATLSMAPSGNTPTPTPTLNALTVSNGSGTVGSALTSTISGATQGSTLSLSGPGSAGLSIAGSTISGTPTTAGAVNIVETLAGATNSPRTTSGAISVAAAGSTAARMLIVAGQSNALALGTTQANAVSNNVANDDPYTFILNPDNSWSPYKPGTKSGGFKEDNSTNDPAWGPEAQFIKLWRAANGTTPLYVVKVARGGTQLASTGSNATPDWSPSSPGELYSRLVSGITSANAYFSANNITATPLAMLWTQWEADSVSDTIANAYGSNLNGFISAMRSNGLGATAPFIFARGHPISDDTIFTSIPLVQAQQQSVAMADTKALQVFQDDIDNGTLTHPGPLGAGIQVGDRYYKALVGTLAPTIFLPTTASVAEGQAFSIPLSATVPNPAYALSGADASKFAISGGNLTMAAKSYGTPTDANANGVYDVTVSATNTLTGAVGTASLSVTVTAASAGDAFVSRLSGTYTPQQTAAQKALIARMQNPANGAPGYWDTRDSIHIPFGLKSAADRLLDWKAMASATLNGTATTDANGFVSATSNAANYATLPIDFSTTQNFALKSGLWSASMLVEFTTEDRAATQYVLGNAGSATFFRLATTTTLVQAALASGAVVAIPESSLVHRWSFNRSGGTFDYAIEGGTPVAVTAAQASTTPAAGAVPQLFRERTTLAGKGNIAYIILGASLTTAQRADFDAAIVAYKAAMA